jgi:hypothetical protein
MSARRLAKVPLYGNAAKAVTVNLDATAGAQIGTNLLMPDGTLATAAKLQALFGAAPSGSSDLGTTDDLEVGAWNLYFTKRRAQDAVGEVLHDSANVTLRYTVDGDTPSITADLTDVTVTAGGTLKKYGFDAKGRLSQQADATTSDLAEGSNLYFTDARARAAAVADAIDPTVTDVAPSQHAVAEALAGATGGVPYLVEDGSSYRVPAGIQALWTLPIELEGDAYLDIEGALVEVN